VVILSYHEFEQNSISVLTPLKQCPGNPCHDVRTVMQVIPTLGPNRPGEVFTLSDRKLNVWGFEKTRSR
jgi:hypothetical protein